MKFHTHLELAKGPLEAAPLASVLFLLLIFVVLSSSFVLQPGVKVDLPVSAVRSPGAFRGMVVTVTRENLLFFNEERINLAGLPKALQDAVQRQRVQELIIKADRQVPHGTVVEIMNMAFAAGIPSIHIATRPASPAASP